MLKSKLIDVAMAVATASPGVGGRKRNSYRLAAVLFDKRERILQCRPNLYKTHPLVQRLTRCQFPFLHAEAHALVAEGLDRCAGLSLLVIRLTRSGTLTMAYPCSSCQALIRHAEISSIYYSDWNGNIKHEQCK